MLAEHRRRFGLKAPPALATAGTRLAAGGAPPYDAGMGQAAHPTAQQLEGLAFRLLGDDEARAAAAHAKGCPVCRAQVQREVRLRQRLRLLRADEPHVDIVDEILQRTGSRDGQTGTTDDACS
jgi:hypothetical protein